MPSRVERVSRFSARPAVSCIEGSTRSPLTGNVENEKGLKRKARMPVEAGLIPCCSDFSCIAAARAGYDLESQSTKNLVRLFAARMSNGKHCLSTGQLGGKRKHIFGRVKMFAYFQPPFC